MRTTSTSLCFLLALLTASSSAFVTPGSKAIRTTSPLAAIVDPDSLQHAIDSSMMVAGNIRDVTIFKGKTLSLLHPVMMASLLAFSVNTALLGFNWRRQRTMGDEISSLKKTLPDLKGASSLQDAIEAASAEDGDASLIPKYEAAKATDAEVNALTAERKELASQGNRDKHFGQGAMLAFLGTTFAIEVRSFVDYDVLSYYLYVMPYRLTIVN